MKKKNQIITGPISSLRSSTDGYTNRSPTIDGTVMVSWQVSVHELTWIVVSNAVEVRETRQDGQSSSRRRRPTSDVIKVVTARGLWDERIKRVCLKQDPAFDLCLLKARRHVPVVHEPVGDGESAPSRLRRTHLAAFYNRRAGTGQQLWQLALSSLRELLTGRLRFLYFSAHHFSASFAHIFCHFIREFIIRWSKVAAFSAFYLLINICINRTYIVWLFFTINDISDYHCSHKVGTSIDLWSWHVYNLLRFWWLESHALVAGRQQARAKKIVTCGTHCYIQQHAALR